MEINMEEEKYTMAELMAEFDRKEKEEMERREQERLAEIEARKQARIAEKERKHQEYLAEKERRHQEYLAEKERKAMADETITCKKCGKEFIWTSSEKKFFKEKGFFRPSMCKECKANQKVRVTFHK